MERLIPAGEIRPVACSEVADSRLGIGFEKLDRDVFDPEKAYDPIAKTGIKWIRLQSGWQRTERVRGVYDFSWLDSIVDNLILRGLRPWICLCYGNELYDDLAKTVFGAVGCPPVKTPEQKAAWSAYVTALTRHFAGRVRWYEIWNEPDWCWKTGPDGTEYGVFAVATAHAIRAGDPDAKVIGGCVCQPSLAWLTEAFEAGMGPEIDALTFHEYTADETLVEERVGVLRALCRRYNPKIEIIQGESGSQSRSGGHGALREGAWTEEKQAKQLLRHAVADLKAGVKFSSYFSTVDMIEALNGKVGDLKSYLDYGYFGVLGAVFDENGRASGTYEPKKSYYALQRLAALLAESPEAAELPVVSLPQASERIFGRDLGIRDLMTCGFAKEGSSAFAYWTPADLMTTTFEGTVSFQCSALPFAPRLADPMDGKIYTFPDSMIRTDGSRSYTLLNIPVRDYPLFLLFGDFLP